MGFQKGNAGGGRPKGSKSKASTQLKIQVQKLLDDNMDMVQHDLDQLEAKDRLKLMIDLMAFVMPKMKSVEATVTAVTDMSQAKIERLERMSDLMLEIEAERVNPDVDLTGEVFKDE